MATNTHVTSKHRKDPPQGMRIHDAEDSFVHPVPFAFANKSMASRFMESVQTKDMPADVAQKSPASKMLADGETPDTRAEVNRAGAMFITKADARKDPPSALDFDLPANHRNMKNTPSYCDRKLEMKVYSSAGTEAPPCPEMPAGGCLDCPDAWASMNITSTGGAKAKTKAPVMIPEALSDINGERQQHIHSGPGAVKVPGSVASISAHSLGSESNAVNVVAHLVRDEEDPGPQIIHAIAKKDSFCELLRHDRRTRIVTSVVSLAIVGLGVTLGVTLSRPQPTPTGKKSVYVPVGSNIDGPDRAFPYGAGDYSKFGSSVSMSRNGSRVAVGAPRYSSADNELLRDRGLVQVFEEQDGEWMLLEPSILGDADGDMAGSSVALSLDGSTLAVGSPEHTARNTFSGEADEKAGQVKVYKRINHAWTQIGGTIFGEAASAMLGSSVGISEDGRRVAISVPGNVHGADEKAKVYEFMDNDWAQLGKDLVGRVGGSPLSMSADGNTIAMGSLSMEENNDIGAMRVYEFVNGDWRLMGSDIILKGAKGSYDTNWTPSISSDGKTIAVGSRVLKNSDLNIIGEEYDLLVKVFRYEEDEGDWAQLGSTLHDKKGPHLIAYVASISADSKVLIIGDPGGFDFGINSGHSHVLRFIDDDWIHIEKELDGFDSADHFGHAVTVSADGTRVSVGAPQSRATGREIGRVSVYEVKDLTA